jgi:hypothetical protein
LEKAGALLEKKGLDRRLQKRLSLSQRGLVQILDSSGKPMGSAFKVRMADISAGGFSFLYKISKEKTARLLLGRKLNLKLGLPAGGRLQKVDRDGTVVAVRSQPFDDYSVHVRFDDMLGEDAVEEMARLFGAGFH